MKKIIVLILLVVMCSSFVACNLTIDLNNDTNNTNAMNNNDTTTIIDNTPILKIGEKVTTDECEFYVDYVDITNDVVPPQADSWYSHYEADDGKVFVDLCVAYKNTNSKNIGADDIMSCELIYSDQYEYAGFSMIEKDSRSDFTYSNITSIAPLSTEYIHYLFEVPEEVEKSENELILKMNIGVDKYKIIVREGNGSTIDNSNKQPGKTSGDVVLKEVVVTKNAEFFIDYSDITNDVVPPQPDNWYSHYEADDGKVFVDICFAYKNTGGKNVGADDVISANLKYADKYEYQGFSMIEKDSRSDFTYSNITSIAPLDTEYVHYLFEVPEEVKTSNNSVDITFTIDRNTYTYKVK